MPEEYVKVTYCGNCPFSVYNDDIQYCAHPDSNPENDLTDEYFDADNEIPPPAWCPLRQKDILIQLSVD